MRIGLSLAAKEQSPSHLVLEAGVFDRAADEIAGVFDERPLCLVVDSTVDEIWTARIEKALPHAIATLRVPAGEACKTHDALIVLLRSLVAARLPRDGVVVAIGGGACGDLAGLASALHLRGIGLVHVPTTLLAIVDAAIGGKCAIDLPEGKNLCGVFHPATLILADPSFLETLPEVELASGRGEIAKYALGFDRTLFDALVEGGMPSGEALVPLLEACVRTKTRIVEQDPYEGAAGKRVLLNLGHTTAHALEGLARARGEHVPHGLAVATGLRVAAVVAEQRGSTSVTAELDTLLARLELPRSHTELLDPPPSAAELIAFTRYDKKRERSTLRLVLPTGVGSCAVFDAREEELSSAIVNTS